jgi:hypothetical protein
MSSLAEICRENPSAPNCRVRLYWPAPQMVLSARKGTHRFSWDLHYEPVGEEPRAAGAPPARCPVTPTRTWTRRGAPPGTYTVRLTVGGREYSRPLTLGLDPRVKTSASKLEYAATLSREMYDAAMAAHAAYEEARAMAGRVTDASLRADVGTLARAAMAMQEAEVGPTERQVGACDAARAQFQEVMERWNALRTLAAP